MKKQPSWKKSPQTVKLWKSKEHARRMMVMGRTLARAQAKNAPVMAALAAPPLPPPPSQEEIRNWLYTPGQSAAVQNIQRMAAEIGRLANLINEQNAVYTLNQPVLRLSELASYLYELDEKLKRARYAARRMGVTPVIENFKTKGVQHEKRAA